MCVLERKAVVWSRAERERNCIFLSWEGGGGGGGERNHVSADKIQGGGVSKIVNFKKGYFVTLKMRFTAHCSYETPRLLSVKKKNMKPVSDRLTIRLMTPNKAPSGSG